MKELNVTTHFTTGAIEEICVQNDKSNFRWTRKYFGLPNGLNYLSEKKEEENRITLTYEYFNGLILTVVRAKESPFIAEKYTLSNPTEKNVEIDDGYSIGLTFADDSDIAEVALNRRAYTRVFQGENTFTVYNSKFNGDEQGVGLVLTEGRLGNVSQSRMRGNPTVFDVEFTPQTLKPKESVSFEWKLFAYQSFDEFISTVREFQPFPILSKYPLFEGETFDIDSGDDIFVDGVKSQKTGFILDKPLLIKATEGEKEFSFTLKPQSEADFAKRLFVKSFYQKEKHLKMLEKAEKEKENAKTLLLQYFKTKNKRYFDFGIPIEIIKNDEDLKKKFLEKAEYAILKEKGFYYPYQTLAKYDYLRKAYSINADERYISKLEELEKLRNAIFRLWY